MKEERKTFDNYNNAIEALKNDKNATLQDIKLIELLNTYFNDSTYFLLKGEKKETIGDTVLSSAIVLHNGSKKDMYDLIFNGLQEREQIKEIFCVVVMDILTRMAVSNKTFESEETNIIIQNAANLLHECYNNKI